MVWQVGCDGPTWRVSSRGGGGMCSDGGYWETKSNKNSLYDDLPNEDEDVQAMQAFCYSSRARFLRRNILLSPMVPWAGSDATWTSKRCMLIRSRCSYLPLPHRNNNQFKVQSKIDSVRFNNYFAVLHSASSHLLGHSIMIVIRYKVFQSVQMMLSCS